MQLLVLGKSRISQIFGVCLAKYIWIFWRITVMKIFSVDNNLCKTSFLICLAHYIFYSISLQKWFGLLQQRNMWWWSMHMSTWMARTNWLYRYITVKNLIRHLIPLLIFTNSNLFYPRFLLLRWQSL